MPVSSSDEEEKPEEVTRKRLERISGPPQPYNFNSYISGEPINWRRIQPYYYDNDLNVQLKEGTYYTGQFFKECIIITENNTPLSDDKIESFDIDEEYSHCVEAL